jgi:hypothetical protein
MPKLAIVAVIVMVTLALAAMAPFHVTVFPRTCDVPLVAFVVAENNPFGRVSVNSSPGLFAWGVAPVLVITMV